MEVDSTVVQSGCPVIVQIETSFSDSGNTVKNRKAEGITREGKGKFYPKLYCVSLICAHGRASGRKDETPDINNLTERRQPQ